MSKIAHLWAVGYENTNGAGQVLKAVKSLAEPEHQHLLLLDIAVVVRNADGSYSIEREPLPSDKKESGHSLLSFLTCLALSAPMLTEKAVDTMLGPAGLGVAIDLRIDESFIHDVKALMKPGTSAIFVLDEEGDLDIILRTIQGLGGTVLRTNVDAIRARLIQSTLNCSLDQHCSDGSD